MNESIYYNVDDIHTAIAQNHSIEFCYMRWDVKGELVPKKHENGETKFYEISPWALSWYDENYYLENYENLYNFYFFLRNNYFLEVHCI